MEALQLLLDAGAKISQRDKVRERGHAHFCLKKKQLIICMYVQGQIQKVFCCIRINKCMYMYVDIYEYTHFIIHEVL